MRFILSPVRLAGWEGKNQFATRMRSGMIMQQSLLIINYGGKFCCERTTWGHLNAS